MMNFSQSLQGQSAALLWFTESQLQYVIRNGTVPEWFHGFISRKTAEELLMSKPPGYFLIRVSESRIGYSLSYRAEDRCRHFMIDALEDGHYIVVGESRRHRFLQDLVDFHRRAPIVPFNEVLTVACGQKTSNNKSDYAELLFPQRHSNFNTSFQQDNSLRPAATHPIPQECIPPTLPQRPKSLWNGQSNRLYPSVENYPNVTSAVPATDSQPVPMTRKRYIVNNSLSTQPPEVPARSTVPPLTQNQACIKTASAPEGSSTPRTSEHTSGANTESVHNHEAKPSVVTNLKVLKKRFQKKRSTSQEFMHTEIDMEATDKDGNNDNEHQEVAEEQTFNHPQSPCTAVPDRGLPQEYLPPPPFAPGY